MYWIIDSVYIVEIIKILFKVLKRNVFLWTIKYANNMGVHKSLNFEKYYN